MFILKYKCMQYVKSKERNPSLHEDQQLLRYVLKKYEIIFSFFYVFAESIDLSIKMGLKNYPMCPRRTHSEIVSVHLILILD